MLRLTTLALLLTAGCAQQRFATRWSLSPHLDQNQASEFQRRETERRQEIAVLQAERAEIDDKLHAMYEISVLRPVTFYSPALHLDRYTAAQRADMARALGRVVEVSHRRNVLSGRLDRDDGIMTRATSLLESLRTFKYVIPPYYGH